MALHCEVPIIDNVRRIDCNGIFWGFFVFLQIGSKFYDVNQGNSKVAVVIPCFRCKKHIHSVINKIGHQVERIYVVDDNCPEETGKYVIDTCTDPRVRTLFHKHNQGVGGAVITGYLEALKEEFDIVVKIDGDDQMDPGLIMHFIAPVIFGIADYTKGNRFYRIENLQGMPKVRLWGNLALSFITKLSTGYWSILDPSNGYTAINKSALRRLELTKLSRRYFFESDILFRLGLIKAKVMDIPMHAKYADEVSNLKIRKIAPEFAIKHFKNLFKRIIYQYLFLDFNVASIELFLGLVLFIWGVLFGVWQWFYSFLSGTGSPIGSVVLPALLIILGVQFLIAFLSYDISKEPKVSLSSEDLIFDSVLSRRKDLLD